jgi:hypothetical protein
MNAKPAILMYVKPFYERGEASALVTNITSQRFIETPVTKNWKVICHVNVPKVMISVLVAFYFVHLTF